MNAESSPCCTSEGITSSAGDFERASPQEQAGGGISMPGGIAWWGFVVLTAELSLKTNLPSATSGDLGALLTHHCLVDTPPLPPQSL